MERERERAKEREREEERKNKILQVIIGGSGGKHQREINRGTGVNRQSPTPERYIGIVPHELDLGTYHTQP